MKRALWTRSPVRRLTVLRINLDERVPGREVPIFIGKYTSFRDSLNEYLYWVNSIYHRVPRLYPLLKILQRESSSQF